jgi:hypothetical protein
MIRRSWLSLGLIPALLVTSIVLPFLLAWEELPNPMATHWDLSGSPNGMMPPVVLLLLMAGVAVAVWASVVRVIRRMPSEAPSFVAGLFGIQALLVAVTSMAVSANRGHSTWETADGVEFVHVLIAVGVALVAGAAGWFLAGGRSIEREGGPGAGPVLDVAGPENLVWASRGYGRVIQVVGIVVIVAGLAMWGWPTLLLLVIGLIVLAFAEVRVTISRRGAFVSLGWLGTPSWRVPLESISRAEVETVSPMAYGGWGYRLRPGVRAIVTRGGDALRMVREGRADLVVTVDDAATGAGLINSMLGVGTGQ